MAFKKKKKTTTSYEDPEALFRDRKNRSVQGLLSHQSDILRRYNNKTFKKANIALELPTGSGKTLVGLLIAEFRRVTQNERVVYLCPTKQLALQVCEQSKHKYGIEATPFIGRIKDYSADDKYKYQTAQTIAVAPYSALFNTNPFFDKPQLIILDDAHAAENYIASNWSLKINRRQHTETYTGLLHLIKDALPLPKQQHFLSDEADDYGQHLIEKIPTFNFASAIPEINSFLNENTEHSDLRYTWKLLKGHLEACHLYISYNHILIRPYIPPALTHGPFKYATQRVFMSATLGLGGDLERITGVPEFHRLPIPDGWDKQGIGRRYFVFPELSLSNEEIEPLTKDMVEHAGRALILVPSKKRTDKYQELFDDIPVFSAKDIESSKDGFVSKKNAIAVLANRYDGIDFLDEDCRLLIIEGLPKAGNLQELFLMSRMVAGNLFKDRIRTRIIQAFGRCTRSATDYAAVIVIGEDFFDWLIFPENRKLFHPELQGELIFGAEQAKKMSHDEFLENLEIFLDHGSEWNDVDEDIRENRDESTQVPIPGQDKLFQAAKHEVNYMYAMWDEDYERSADIAQKVANILSGDDLRGLRGFWNYLAASASEITSTQLDNRLFMTKAIDLYQKASACLPAVSWLRILANRTDTAIEDMPIEDDELLNSNVEQIEMLFERRSFGLPIKFEKTAKAIIQGLHSDDSDTFEEAHRLLGEMLGFEAKNSSGNATPDPWWISNGTLCLVAEDKSDSKPNNAVAIKHIRQAASHENWIDSNVTLNPNAEIYTVLITTQAKIHKDVPTYAAEVGWWYIEDFQVWAQNAINVLRKLRGTYVGPGQEQWREFVREQLLTNHLDPRSIVKTATQTLLRDVEIE